MFHPETESIANELRSAGIEIYAPARQINRNNVRWFQFRKGDLVGYYSGESFDHSWSMPIKPSRVHGSGMFVEAAENASTHLEAALIILSETNYNDIVGTHSNFASDRELSSYVQV